MTTAYWCIDCDRSIKSIVPSSFIDSSSLKLLALEGERSIQNRAHYRAHSFYQEE